MAAVLVHHLHEEVVRLGHQVLQRDDRPIRGAHHHRAAFGQAHHFRLLVLAGHGDFLQVPAGDQVAIRGHHRNQAQGFYLGGPSRRHPDGVGTAFQRGGDQLFLIRVDLDPELFHAFSL